MLWSDEGGGCVVVSWEEVVLWSVEGGGCVVVR